MRPEVITLWRRSSLPVGDTVFGGSGLGHGREVGRQGADLDGENVVVR